MDIDQRLDRLTERHEALTQSLELFIASTRENDQRLTRHMGDLMDTMNRLGHFVIFPDERLDDAARRLDDFEGKS
jgi:hypothetical protein